MDKKNSYLEIKIRVFFLTVFLVNLTDHADQMRINLPNLLNLREPFLCVDFSNLS